MRISKEFLLEAFGLSLMVMLILVSVQIFQRMTRLTELISQEQESQISRLEEYEVVQYDGLYLDGVTAAGYIKNMVEQYELPVLVTTKQKKFTVTGKELYGELRNAASVYYMSPLELYYCEVIRNANQAVKEIKITVEGEEEK